MFSIFHNQDLFKQTLLFDQYKKINFREIAGKIWYGQSKQTIYDSWNKVVQPKELSLLFPTEVEIS